MNNYLISVIIPSFNTSRVCLERCVNSVCNQNYNNIELLIVDDGSDEQFKNYYDDINKLDDRIKIIIKDHSGVSDTRNVGIAQALGDYIIFIDSDDTIPEYFFERAVDIIIKYKNPDLIIGGIEYIPYEKINDMQYGEKEEYFSENEIDLLKKSMLKIKTNNINYTILGSQCGKLYKSSVIKNIRFPVGVPLCEDQVFNRRVLLNIKSAVIVPEMWYEYYQNDFSVMHTKVKENHWEMKKLYWDELYKLDFLENIEMKPYLRMVYFNSFFYNMNVICKDNNKSLYEKKKIFYEAVKHPLIEEINLNELLVQNRTLKFKIKYFVMKIGKFLPFYISSYFIK